jgi:hypothetical protein
MGVNGKLKWLAQGGNYRTNDSPVPRLLTSVYTPLLRCATASDACNLACGLRNKQTGSCSQFPVLHFWARFSLRLGTLLSSLCPSLLHHLRQSLSTCRGETVTLPFAASGLIGSSTRPCSGFRLLSIQRCYGSTESVPLPLQFRYDSSCIQGALLWPLLVQDFVSASVDTSNERPHIISRAVWTCDGWLRKS